MTSTQLTVPGVGAAAGSAGDLSAVEAADLWAYGHSYTAGVGASTAARNFVQRLGVRGRFNTVNNRGVAGSLMSQVIAIAANGPNRDGQNVWGVGTKGLVTLNAVINEVIQVNAAGDAQAHIGFAEALRTLLRIFRASQWVPETDASCTFPSGSTSTANLNVARLGTIQHLTGASCQVKITTAAKTIRPMILRFCAGQGFVHNWTVAVNGVPVGTYAATPLWETSSTQQPNQNAFELYAVPVPDLPAGTNVVTITADATATNSSNGQAATPELWFNGYLVMGNPTPPTIAVVKDVPLLAAGYAFAATGGADTNKTTANLQVFNGQVDAVLAEPEFNDGTVVAVDPGPLWVPSTMLSSADGLHPNNLGHNAYATAIARRIAALPIRDGLAVP